MNIIPIKHNVNDTIIAFSEDIYDTSLRKLQSEINKIAIENNKEGNNGNNDSAITEQELLEVLI